MLFLAQQPTLKLRPLYFTATPAPIDTHTSYY